MSVAVYSRLGDLLRDRGMTVRDLQQEIAARYGLAVDARTLDRLAQADRVRRPDLEIAAAAAAVLDAELGDIFAADVISVGDDVSGRPDEIARDDLLDPEHGERLHTLFTLQDRRSLTHEEQAELDALVAAWARAVGERGMRELSARQGIPIEQVRAETLAAVDRASAWWQEAQANPALLEQAVREARALHKARTTG